MVTPASTARHRSAVEAPEAGLLSLHPTHYERLQLPEEAGPAQIDAAWQRCQAAHPALREPAPVDPPPSLVLPGVADGPALQIAALRLAHAVLSDPQRRAVYDGWLRHERQVRQAQQRRARWAGFMPVGRLRRVVALLLLFGLLAGAVGALAWLVLRD